VEPKQVKNALSTILASVESDLDGASKMVEQSLASHVHLIEQMGKHIVTSGGKRLRPALVLLCARALGYEGDRHIPLAAAVELIHTATLLHDDVVDHSTLRRGRSTANALWGNEASVLVGDFLYSRAFELLVKYSSLEIMQVISSASNQIAEGEMMQLEQAHRTDTSEDLYLEIIRRKTAILFSASCRIGAMLVTDDEKIIDAMADYGINLGLAFQMIDDVLDFTGDKEIIGKNLGDDLAEGKASLPLIHVLHQGTPEDVAFIGDAIRKGCVDQVDQICDIIAKYDAVQYTVSLAQTKASSACEAITVIPATVWRHTLEQLSLFAVNRHY